jgi:hypothetical protein
LTAGQKGDAPQAVALLEGLPAEVVMADTAYDADHLREASPPRERSPSSRTIRHGRSNIPSTSISMPSAISLSAASQNSSNSAASQPASKRPPEITAPSSLSRLSSYGCDKCPHDLAPQAGQQMNPVSITRQMASCRIGHASLVAQLYVAPSLGYTAFTEGHDN